MSEVDGYGLKALMGGVVDIEPSLSQLKRRRIARSLQNISSHIVHMDASDGEMNYYSQELDALERRFSAHNKVDSAGVFQRMCDGEASGDDVLLDQDYSILIGKASAIGFPMELEVLDDRVKGTAYVPLSFQGPPQRVHGGVVATIFDILLSRTQVLCDFMGFTASLKIDYKKATPIETKLELEAWVQKVDGRKLLNGGKITANGEVCATAEGLWIQPNSNALG